MAVEQDAASFGQKLDWLKSVCKVTDGEIGAAVGVSDSLVCRWRKDKRVLDRRKEARTLERLARFLLEQALGCGQGSVLAGALGLDEAGIEAESRSCQLALAAFLYDGQAIRGGAARADAAQMRTTGLENSPQSPPQAPSQGQPQNPPQSPPQAPPQQAPPQACYFGFQGLLAAIQQLEQHMRGTTAKITAYLSLEHSRILCDPQAGRLWEGLWRLGGGSPVRLVFDKWDSPDEATRTLRGLLPFMQAGWLRLSLIKSTQKFFYSNISFFAEGAGLAGMVITTQPAGGLGESVSMLLGSPEYISGMAAVFARFDKNTKAVEKHLGLPSTKEEAVCFEQLFAPGADLKAVLDGVSLLYLDAESYLRLLSQNGVSSSQRAYRLQRFTQDKQRFESFLAGNRMTEVLSLAAIDQMLASGLITTPDLSFYSGTMKAERQILQALLGGMLSCLERQNNLSIYLSRHSGRPGFSCRLKGDSFVLLHSYQDSARHAAYSDTWLLVYEYHRQFEEALQDEELIKARDSVRTALRIRLESLGG